MAIDPILGAGYLPKSGEYRASVSGDETNNKLRIQNTSGIQRKSLFITLPENIRIDLAQLDIKIVSATSNTPILFGVSVNNVNIVVGGSRSDPTFIPITLFSGAIGSIFQGLRGDNIELWVEANTGTDYILVTGGLALFGTYV